MQFCAALLVNVSVCSAALLIGYFCMSIGLPFHTHTSKIDKTFFKSSKSWPAASVTNQGSSYLQLLQNISKQVQQVAKFSWVISNNKYYNNYLIEGFCKQPR